MEMEEIAILAFNILNGLMICLAISIAGLGTYVWNTEIPEVSTWYERAVAVQGLVAAFLGGFVSVMAWLGTFGVNDEKPKLVIAYKAIFGALVIPTMVLGVMTLIFVSKWMTTEDDIMRSYMENYYKNASSANITDGIQLGFGCCGLKPLPYSYSEGKKLPTSCCDPLLFHDTKDTIYCKEKYKFDRTCEGVLKGHLELAITWLSSLLLLLAVFFVSVLVDLHFVRHALRKPPFEPTVVSQSATTAAKESKAVSLVRYLHAGSPPLSKNDFQYCSDVLQKTVSTN